MSDGNELLCPMPECGEALTIVYTGLYCIHWNDPGRAEQFKPDGVDSQTWRVECLAGHVILVPGSTGCDCTDHDEGAPCPIEDLFDWGDDHDNVRVFQPHDWARLCRVLDLLPPVGGAS